jgi:hypothetical protein
MKHLYSVHFSQVLLFIVIIIIPFSEELYMHGSFQSEQASRQTWDNFSCRRHVSDAYCGCCVARDPLCRTRLFKYI